MNGPHKVAAGCLLMLLLTATVAFARSDPGSQEDVHRRWIESASAGLDPEAIDTLHRIQGANRQLLALRAYLRAGASLPARWSWSQQKLSTYPDSAEGKAAADDSDAVIAAFANANPGYQLQVNRQPRSLERQLAHWNDNASVSVVADALTQSLDQRFGNAVSPAPAQLRNALMTWAPASAAALAAPGLSAHGQGRAFDFAIARGGQIVAGLDAAAARSRWDAAGWTQKLHAAVVASHRSFVGPLQSPYEPWHYAYTPQ